MKKSIVSKIPLAAVFSILMILKMYFTWTVIQGSIPTYRPLITDLPAIMVLFGLIELLVKKRKLLAYTIVDTIVTTIYFAILMYYKYYGVIVDYHALMQLKQVTEVKSSVLTIMHPIYLLVFVDIVVIIGLCLCSKAIRNWGNQDSITYPRWMTLGVLAVTMLLCLMSISTNMEIVNEHKMAEKMGFLNYEVHTIMDSMFTDTIPAESVTPEAVKEAKQETVSAVNEHFGDAKDKNIIVIQLESFQDFLVGLKVGDHEVTPVLNDLMKQSYYFSNFYQQIGQGNTSDAEYLLNTSLYVPQNGASSQVYSDKELPGLPRMVKDYGYQSLTFHTNSVEFWNRDKLYHALGFDQYYDQAFFGDEDFIHFGASDEVLYKKTAEELKKKHDEGQKFYANLISMTNHHPFDLPESKHPIKLPDEYDNTLVGNYIASAHYTDEALGKFFDELKEAGIWEDCMIVIYGDHFGLPVNSLSQKELGLMKNIVGRDYDYTDMFNIPLFISIPGVSTQQELQHVGGQIDIMPTIANLAGFSMDNRVFFGKDLLNNTSTLLPMRYYLPSGSFINDNEIFIPGEKVSDGEQYALKYADPLLPNDHIADEFATASQLLAMSDSYVRGLPRVPLADESHLAQNP
ncbi:LTA synthase family protein [Paenibacillus sp. KN14-4R]|uniref:LTA synthase family protein n=1 Tax=Paenibacillus sp. KN14-4R TaxID=3445773 RepID=UPI003F9FEFBE